MHKKCDNCGKYFSASREYCPHCQKRELSKDVDRFSYNIYRHLDVTRIDLQSLMQAVHQISNENANIDAEQTTLVQEMAGILKDTITFLNPEVQRGPAEHQWVGLMQRITTILNMPFCPKCNGDPPTRDCCYRCYNVGRDWREE